MWIIEDSDDEVASGGGGRYEKLARAKREDMKETYDEEVGHYTAKRRHNDEERLTDSEDDCEAPPAKNPHLEVEEGSPEKKMTAAERMMARMVEPVALSTQRGRIGLGHGATKKKMTIEDETEFCDGEILRQMIKAKDVFDVMSDRDLREARTRANPYETIGGAFFQNRAAMKTANLDKVFDWLFSGEDESTVMLGKFAASSSYYFEPFYGVHNDGDVMKPDNIDSLEGFIHKGTSGVGVDLMMADGGFSVEGQENIQKVDSADDVNIIVPPDVMRDDDDFLAYLTRHNERLALRQTTYLKKYLSFARNQSLIDKDQGSLREECLNYWRIPNRTRSDRRERDRLQIDPDQYFGRFTRKIYGREDFNVRLPSFSLDLISNPSDKQLKYAEFTFNLLTKRVASQPQLLISTGEAVFMWNKQWERCDNKIMRIPDRTVLLVEKVTTYKRDDTRLQRLATDGLIRILDAAVLNGDDVSNLTYINRMKAAAKFCKALKLVVPTIREGWGKNERLLTPPPLVVAEYYSLNQLREVRRQFTRYRFEGEDVFLFEEHGHLIICKGVRIFRILKDSWKMGWSCSQSRLYAFPVQQRPTLGSLYESDWEKHECCASFWESAMTKKDVTGKQQMQCLWKWENSCAYML
uniref:Cap-specific mRNA (nucleoside-2'-O-)-methyltransferase 1 n=1 Tax=Heterorhabditis bacteriophora TaxID=37862 RepID=A0A1I7XT99_HETBA